MSEEYTNDESRRITKLLNEARKECGLEAFLPEVEVRFIKTVAKKETSEVKLC